MLAQGFFLPPILVILRPVPRESGSISLLYSLPSLSPDCLNGIKFHFSLFFIFPCLIFLREASHPLKRNENTSSDVVRSGGKLKFLFLFAGLLLACYRVD